MHIDTDILHIATNILHVTADILYLPRDTHRLPINTVHHLHLLRRCHSCFSSRVNLSSLSELSLVSLFPINIIKCFSEQPLVRKGNIQGITSDSLNWSTFRFLCSNHEDCQYLNHNISNHVCHCRIRCDAGVYLKPTDETFDAVIRCR